MIEPIWIDDESCWPNTIEVSPVNQIYNTCLRLRFDKSSLMKFSKLNQDIEDAFDERLILFLNKIQVMILEDKCRDISIHHSREMLTPHWTYVASTSKQFNEVKTSESYWYKKRLTFCPNIKRTSRDENIIQSTNIDIAVKFIKVASNDLSIIEASPSNSYLKLDLTSGLLPIYAFLPTKSFYFSFIIQADFVLGTSREGLAESDEWNLLLLNHVPQLFCDIIQELSYYSWKLFDNTSEDVNKYDFKKYCPTLIDLIENGNEDDIDFDNLIGNQVSIMSLKNDSFPIENHDSYLDDNDSEYMSKSSNTIAVDRRNKYELAIEPNDVLSLLPRVHMNMKDSDIYKKLIRDIYHNLQDIPWLRTSSHKICKSTEVFLFPAIFKNIPMICSLLNDEFLFSCTGKYFLHDTYEFEEDLLGYLQIPKFDYYCIVNCMERLSIDYFQNLDSIDSINDGEIGIQVGKYVEDQKSSRSKEELYNNMLKSTSILFLALELLCNTKNALVPKKHTINGPVPSKVIVNAKKETTKTIESIKRNLSNTSTHSSILSLEMIEKLKSLKIWPVSESRTFESIVDNVMFVQNSNNENINNKSLSKSFNILKQTLLEVDGRLFDIADAAQMNSSNRLNRFFLSYFRSKKSVLGNGNSIFGGLEVLTTDFLIKQIIFPAFSDHTNGKIELTRELVSSYVSIIFHSKYWNRAIEFSNCLSSHGFYLPTARVKDNPCTWYHSGVQYISKQNIDKIEVPSSNEIHLGVEFKVSSTNKLVEHHVTALKQIDWTIVDPYLSSLVLNIDFSSYSQKDLLDKFAFPDSSNDLKDWKNFLFAVGVVDLFGVYHVNNEISRQPSVVAPYLIAHINHLTTNGVKLHSTPSCMTTEPSTDLVIGESLDAVSNPDDVANSVPIWLKFPEDGLLSVSKVVYNSFQVN